MSETTKKVLIGGVAAIILIGGGWAYLNLTTVPPPALVEGSPPEKAEELAAYLGNSRGFGRLEVEQQEQFLVRAFQVYGEGEGRARFIQSLRRMSTDEREVLSNAVFEISRGHVMEYAREYANTPPAQRGAFINQASQDFEAMRAQIGGGSSANSLSDPLKGNVPTDGNELMKLVITKTDAGERAKAKPFLDAMAEKYKAEKAAKRK